MTSSYLIFRLYHALYAVDALAVREIFWLPELKPLAEVPPYIVGGVNLRGRVVPVMDLSVRLGFAAQRYRTNDSVIIFERDGTWSGVMVNEVRDVRSLAEEDIEPSPSYRREGDTRLRFVSGVAKVGEDLVMRLDLAKLLRLPESSEDWSEAEGTPSAVERSFCPDATAEERAVFRARARGLMQPLASQDFAGLMPLAVVDLNGEYFGIRLDVVREFGSVRSVTPVPCCPEHVVGQMNLRGDIVTLVDVRAALRMPLGNAGAGGKMVVIQNGDQLVGVPVDDVLDVIYLSPSEVTSLPVAVQSSQDEFLHGTAPYNGKMLGLLDVPKILTQGGLIVEEEI